MEKKAGLYRAEFHPDCPKEQAGAARFRQCGTMVGDWDDVLDAIKRYHQSHWVEIFDADTDKRLVGPLAPSAQMPDTVQSCHTGFQPTDSIPLASSID
jgi:hypothetical protein